VFQILLLNESNDILNLWIAWNVSGCRFWYYWCRFCDVPGNKDLCGL